jgi:glycosyltransferase involved in cell wall biosynthesis
VVTVSEPKTAFVQERVPQLPADRFFTITNGYDPEEYEGLQGEGREEAMFRIVYTGRLFKNRRGYELLQALGALFAGTPQAGRKIRVEYYGGVAPEIASRMQHLIQEHDLQENVRFFPDVSYSRSKALQKGADALLLIVDTGETTSGVIPGKLFEYIAAGRPILCIAREGATPAIIRQGNLGRVVQPGDVQGLTEVLAGLLKDAERTFQPDLDFLSQFDRRNLAQQMDQVLALAMNGPMGTNA